MRISVWNRFFFAVPLAAAFAQTTTLEMNVIYVCPSIQASMKVYSCEGPAANNWCDVQTASPGRGNARGKSTRQQVMALLQLCRRPTAQEEQAAARMNNNPGGAPAAGAASGPGGFKVGDTVRVLIDGWGEARVIGINGNSFRVRLPNGIEVSKMWPYEIHRVGTLTAADHAAGQYDLHDRVQVLVNGKWMEGEVRGQRDNMYDIKVPGVDTGFGSDVVNTTANNIRMSTAPPPAAAARRAAGQAPKAGLTSCSSKYDGRWEMTPGGSLRIVFRGGAATISDALAAPQTYDCFMGGGQISFYKPGEFKAEYLTLLPNNDGTLQSDIGPLKKMGN